jgi:hemolysin III
MDLHRALDRVVAAEMAKPFLRGYSHAVMAPIALLGSGLLVALSATPTKRATVAVYGATLVALFGCSAIYHVGTWTPRVAELLRRLDHANIYLLIAGTYTPITVVALRGSWRTVILGSVWTLAVVGIAIVITGKRLFRPLEAFLYVATGWVAVAALPALWAALGPGPLMLLVAGGTTYSAGALVFAFRRPRLWHRVFGYHELFHLLVIAASVMFFIFIAAFVVPFPSS